MKKGRPEFEDKSLELAISDYYSLEFVEYREDQSHIVKHMADLLHKRISINDLAIQGFIMRAIRNWQIQSGIKISQLLKMSPSNRVKHVRIMFDNLEKELTSVLVNTSGEKFLKNAIEEAYTVYVQEFSKRKSRLY